jgi:hypothetical protein
VDLVLVEIDLPPVRALRLIDVMKHDGRWRRVLLVAVYPHEPYDEDLFAVWRRGPDVKVWGKPEESRAAFLRKNLPGFLARLPALSEGESRATANDAVPP